MLFSYTVPCVHKWSFTYGNSRLSMNRLGILVGKADYSSPLERTQTAASNLIWKAPSSPDNCTTGDKQCFLQRSLSAQTFCSMLILTITSPPAPYSTVNRDLLKVGHERYRLAFVIITTAFSCRCLHSVQWLQLLSNYIPSVLSPISISHIQPINIFTYTHTRFDPQTIILSVLIWPWKMLSSLKLAMI
jgi:hypothetical protein